MLIGSTTHFTDIIASSTAPYLLTALPAAVTIVFISATVPILLAIVSAWAGVAAPEDKRDADNFAPTSSANEPDEQAVATPFIALDPNKLSYNIIGGVFITAGLENSFARVFASTRSSPVADLAEAAAAFAIQGVTAEPQEVIIADKSNESTADFAIPTDTKYFSTPATAAAIEVPSSASVAERALTEVATASKAPALDERNVDRFASSMQNCVNNAGLDAKSPDTKTAPTFFSVIPLAKLAQVTRAESLSAGTSLKAAAMSASDFPLSKPASVELATPRKALTTTAASSGFKAPAGFKTFKTAAIASETFSGTLPQRLAEVFEHVEAMLRRSAVGADMEDFRKVCTEAPSLGFIFASFGDKESVS